MFIYIYNIINCLCHSQHWTHKFPSRKQPRKWTILVDDVPGVGRPRKVPGRGCSCRMRSWMMMSLANLTAGATGGERRFLELQLLQIPWQGLAHPDLFSNYEKLREAIEQASSQEVERILRILGSWFQKSLFFYKWSLKRPKNLADFFYWILVSRKTGSRFILMLVKRCCSTKTEGALSERASTKPEKTKTAVTDRWISFELPFMLLPKSATLRCWERAELWRVVKRNTIIFFTLSISLADIVSSNKIPTWPTELGCGLSLGLHGFTTWSSFVRSPRPLFAKLRSVFWRMRNGNAKFSRG